MSAVWRRMTTLVLLLALGLPRSIHAQSDDPAIAAARTRQNTVKTVDIQFRYTEIQSKGSMSNAIKMFSGGPIPPVETTIESVNRLVLDGIKCRFESNHPMWHIQYEKLIEREFVLCFDGELKRKFVPNDSGGPQGVIDNPSRFDSIKLPLLRPIALCFRGLEPFLCAYPIDRMTATGRSLNIDGVQCREYLRGGKSDVAILWVDPKQDFVVRRVQILKSGHLVEQQDIKYRVNEGLWQPESWTRNTFSNDGAIQIVQSSEVISAKINELKPETEFQIVFPPGTRVSDNRTLKQYRVDSEGRMRELSSTGDELPTVVWQPGTPWFRRHKWLLMSCVVATAVILLTYLFRRRSKGAQRG